MLPSWKYIAGQGVFGNLKVHERHLYAMLQLFRKMPLSECIGVRNTLSKLRIFWSVDYYYTSGRADARQK
jgi:hypothetical protein